LGISIENSRIIYILVVYYIAAFISKKKGHSERERHGDEGAILMIQSQLNPSPQKSHEITTRQDLL